MERVGRRRLKPERFIEGSRLLVGVDNHGPDADDLCGMKASEQGILEKGSTQATPLVGRLDGQPSEDGYRYRLPRGLALGQTLGALGRIDLPDGQGVVADDGRPVARRYVDPCRPHGLGVAGVAVDPRAERRLAAVELAEVMLAAQGLRMRVGHAAPSYSKTLGFEKRFLNPAGTWAGRSNRSMNFSQSG